MPIIWKTKNINIQNYYKIIRRTIIFNSSWTYWKKFKEEWTVHVMPVDKVGEYSQFYTHLLGGIEKFSEGIAWGITGNHEIVLFIVDSRNPFIIRSNAMPIAHELLHAIYQDNVGTSHITRYYDSPDGNIGTKGPAATVIVHDNWYGSKETLRFWISWGLGYLPITIPYIPIWKAKKDYSITIGTK